MLYFVWLNSTLTSPYRPLFEVVYGMEVIIMSSLLLMAPLAAIGISIASPLHRNFRLVILLAVTHMVLGTLARLALLYEQIFA
ncbi:hypothetical protein PMAYCL1PPCAC_16886, partial [Pristionchus mayeri]